MGACDAAGYARRNSTRHHEHKFCVIPSHLNFSLAGCCANYQFTASFCEDYASVLPGREGFSENQSGNGCSGGIPNFSRRFNCPSCRWLSAEAGNADADVPAMGEQTRTLLASRVFAAYADSACHSQTSILLSPTGFFLVSPDRPSRRYRGGRTFMRAKTSS